MQQGVLPVLASDCYHDYIQSSTLYHLMDDDFLIIGPTETMGFLSKLEQCLDKSGEKIWKSYHQQEAGRSTRIYEGDP